MTRSLAEKLAPNGPKKILACDGGGILGVVEHLMDRHDVDRHRGEGQGVHVGLADLDVGEAGAGQVGAGHRQHLARLVNAGGALGVARQHLEDAAGAGADVEERADVIRE